MSVTTTDEMDADGGRRRERGCGPADGPVRR